MNLSSKTVGWCDAIVQLRELGPAELNAFESALRDNDVSVVVSAGFSPKRDLQKVQLCTRPGLIELYHGWGLHPSASLELNHREFQKDIESFAPDFIGELGLDKRCLETLAWSDQVERAQMGIELALEFRLPLLWHSVHATQRSLELIEAAASRGARGVWHSFHGSLETAKRLVDLGWKIGVGPGLLRPKAHRLGSVLRSLPRASLLLESDWPQPRGSYNLGGLGTLLAEVLDVDSFSLREELRASFFDLLGKDIA